MEMEKKTCHAVLFNFQVSPYVEIDLDHHSDPSHRCSLARHCFCFKPQSTNMI